MTDGDYFVAGATIVIVAITGANLCFLVGIRAKLNDTNRRVDSIANRYGRLMDFLEGNEIVKRRRGN